MPQLISVFRILLAVSLAAASFGDVTSLRAGEPAPTASVPSGFVDEHVAGVVGATDVIFAPGPEPKMIVTRQTGEIEVLDVGGGAATRALDIRSEICYDWERGLAGITLDPNFTANRYAYIFATFGPCDPTNIGKVLRFVVKPDWTFDPASRVTILDRFPSLTGSHNGGDLHFGKDGKLYVSTGDAHTGGALAQDLGSLAGKILRLNPDGSPASDNPFFQASGAQRCGDADGVVGPGPCQEVFAYGLRNPFRIAMDPNAPTTRFFINDVGQSTWEEVDEGVAGANYGWPMREGPCPIYAVCIPNLPTGQGLTDPVYWHGREIGGAVTGGAFVPDGIGWPAEFSGTYLVADYASGVILRLNPGNGANGAQYVRSPFVKDLGASSAVGLVFGPNPLGSWSLYYTNYQNGGEIRRVTYLAAGALTAHLSAAPVDGTAPLTVAYTATVPIGIPPYTFTWAFGDGASAAGSPTVQHTFTSDGVYTTTLTVANPYWSTTDQQVVQVGTLPTLVLDLPSPDTTFRVGQTIAFQGSANDKIGAPIASSALRWQVWLHHVDEGHPEQEHTHPYLVRDGVSSGTFTGPAPEDLRAAALSYLEIRLTAQDSFGLTGTLSREVRPHRVSLAFATLPDGLIVNVGDDVNVYAVNNASVTGWAGWTITATAPLVQSVVGAGYVFQHWADGPTTPQRSILVGTSDSAFQAIYGPTETLWLPLIGHP